MCNWRVEKFGMRKLAKVLMCLSDALYLCAPRQFRSFRFEYCVSKYDLFVVTRIRHVGYLILNRFRFHFDFTIV